jgi:Domain of unknown function (DUF6456)
LCPRYVLAPCRAFGYAIAMPARNRTRAARRIVERTRRNLEAVEAGATLAEDRPKRNRQVRHRTRLEELEARSVISPEQKNAGDRLCRDYYASNTMIGRLTASYEPRMRSHQKYQATPDTPRSVAARQRFDNALAAAGPLAAILVHTCVTDLAPSAWGPANGKAADDGPALLRLGLDTLVEFYSGNRHGARRHERLDAPRSPPGASQHLAHGAGEPRRRMQEARRFCPEENLAGHTGDRPRRGTGAERPVAAWAKRAK